METAILFLGSYYILLSTFWSSSFYIQFFFSYFVNAVQSPMMNPTGFETTTDRRIPLCKPDDPRKMLNLGYT